MTSTEGQNERQTYASRCTDVALQRRERNLQRQKRDEEGRDTWKKRRMQDACTDLGNDIPCRTALCIPNSLVDSAWRAAGTLAWNGESRCEERWRLGDSGLQVAFPPARVLRHERCVYVAPSAMLAQTGQKA